VVVVVVGHHQVRRRRVGPDHPEGEVAELVGDVEGRLVPPVHARRGDERDARA
jgi:hypothetical protein